MSLRSYRTLVAIAQDGSFVRAAEALNMTVSAVSMQMKSLEDSLDAALFDRSRRPPQLTPLGREVAARARRLVEGEDRLRAACRAPGTLRGAYRIGFVLTSSVRYLPSFLARTRDRFPAARIEIETGLSDDLIARVLDGRLDAAVVTEMPDLPSALRPYPVADEPLVWCLPALAEGWSLETCEARLPFIHFMPRTGIGRLIALHLERAGRRPRPEIVLDSVAAVAECVAAGVGFSILPEPDIRHYGGGDIRLRALGPEPVTRRLALVAHETGALGADAGLLVDALRGDGPAMKEAD
ncbi:MAG: LysR family transcriptional regulator [Paracoccaceae bacterium]